MSEALKEARKRKVTHEQAREAWKKLHDALYNQGRVPTLSVPPRPEDVDIVLTDYISQQEAWEAALSRSAPDREAPFAEELENLCRKHHATLFPRKGDKLYISAQIGEVWLDFERVPLAESPSGSAPPENMKWWFNEREAEVIDQIANRRQISRQKVLQLALRTYQLIDEGSHKLVEANPDLLSKVESASAPEGMGRDTITKFYPAPWTFKEDAYNGGPGIVDAKGNCFVTIFWALHSPEETEQADAATFSLGRKIASLAHPISESETDDLRFQVGKLLEEQGEDFRLAHAELLDAYHAMEAESGTDAKLPIEIVDLLTNVAQLLDVIKGEWGDEWSAWDQEQRDAITKHLMAYHYPDSGRSGEKSKPSCLFELQKAESGRVEEQEPISQREIHMQYTPTPWHTSKEGDGPMERNLICDAKGNTLAEVHHSGIEWEEFEGNTLLMRAAPSLWEALNQIASPDQTALQTSAYVLQKIAQEAINNIESCSRPVDSQPSVKEK